MKLGIRQPYFFPHLGYFDLINYSDKWIIFDTVQYIRKGWMNRNRILHPQGGWQYIRVPIRKCRQSALIKDVRVSDSTNWRSHILGQIQHYRKKAPFFTSVLKLMEECLENREDRLSKLNGIVLEKICQYLSIPFDYKYFSEVNLSIGLVEGPGDWALRISEVFETSEYVDSPGGTEYFDSSRFEEVGTKLVIRDMLPMEYSPKGYKFVPRLSIVDVLMWNSPEQVKEYLNR